MGRVLGRADSRQTVGAALMLSHGSARRSSPGREDRFFPLEHGERFAKIIPGARFEAIEGSRTFSPEDRPERLAELIRGFVRERTATAA